MARAARAIASLCVVLLVVAGAGCFQNSAFGYVVPLINDYSLASDHAGSYAIVDSTGGLVTDNATYGMLIAVDGGVIAGRMDTETDAYSVASIPDRYFVIDTERDSVEENLSEAEYLAALKQAGIDRPPALRRPSTTMRFGAFGWVREALLDVLWLLAFASVPVVITFYVYRAVRRKGGRKGWLRLAWIIPFVLFAAANFAMFVI
ncbi:MAG: hypothetical protein ABR585_13165 [Gemmatimonadaceae bacterium]